VPCDQSRVSPDFWRLGKLTNELKITLIREAAREPQEWFFQVVAAPGTKVVVLVVRQAFFSVAFLFKVRRHCV
jgi:hypothetical protein